ncbi:hypothetical protein A2U01_0041959, partial [Trifolium medium]|nr:hypothetical protein [Trifolium medium]
MFMQEFNLANPVASAPRNLRPSQVTWGLVIRNNNEEVVYAAMERAGVVVEALGLRWGMLM